MSLPDGYRIEKYTGYALMHGLRFVQTCRVMLDTPEIIKRLMEILETEAHEDAKANAPQPFVEIPEVPF